MAYKAKATILLGIQGEIQPGETVPASYVDAVGKRQDTDFDRLKELDLVEGSASPKRQAKRQAKRSSKRSSKAKSSTSSKPAASSSSKK